ncbi:BatA domain-containing protein [Mycolicibacterium peregrinum]|uniref:BatA domain-containing protein n=1 Tax=Mycolicibacterium peregrinum TaxID=43304 RepID=UPI0006D7B7C0|nr:BatA domain-containing protein [Mycolicibacterium peregrinum]MCV7201004.1 BatA domain-containing protein [Mycolicibacterium peregrinum]ORW57923.1 hypothetical protein AWC21_16950 [Mycolicibacterium peregrinum]
MGVLSLSGFQHRWFFLCALVAVGLLALYVHRYRAKGIPVLRFANMDVLAAVAPSRSRRLRHVPAALVLISILLLTIALADPTRDHLIPRNRAVVMLVIDVSESMSATDVAPNRLAAAQEAGKKFEPAERTATGEGIYTALQAIATVSGVIGGGDGPPPARIVLESDGKETVPLDPDQPRGAFAAARAAKAQGVPISAISFGTPEGYVDLNDQQIAVPVDDQTVQQISKLSGDDRVFHADTIGSLEEVYRTLQQQIGFQLAPADASAGWIILATLTLAAAALAGLVLNRRLPG